MKDYAQYLIDEKSEGFAGREWVFAQINKWAADADGSRFFVVEGEPGSGKTALAAQLTQIDRNEHPHPPDCPHLAPGFLSAVHFCSRQDSTLLEPQTFVESLALQLAGRYPEYRQALAEVSGEPAIRIEQHIKNMSLGASAVGLMVRGNLTLNLGGLSAEKAFARTIINPLFKLYHHGLAEPIIFLIDSLDEAALYTGAATILTLLSRLRGLPPNVRFIVTTRPRLEITRPLKRRGMTTLSLSAPENQTYIDDDIASYITSYIKEHPQLIDHVTEDGFVNKMNDIADGNFLVLRSLLTTLGKRGITSLEDLEELPSTLDDVYFEDIEEYGLAEEWDRYSLILGTLIVAQIPLNTRQVEVFTGLNSAKEGLRDVIDFLDFDKRLPAEDRTYAIYHRSFADFLLDQNRSEDYYCRAAAYHAQIADYFLSQYGTKWNTGDAYQIRDYGLRFAAAHLSSVARAGLPPLERTRRSKELVDLVRNANFQQAHIAQFDNLLWLQRDLERALQTAVDTGDVDDLTNIFRASLGLQSLRERELDPVKIFTLAEKGNLDAAIRRLTLFSAEPRWLDVARLLCAWLANEQNPDAAIDIVDRLENTHHPWPFDQLRETVNAALVGQSASRFPLQEPPSEDEVLGILAQESGVDPAMMEGLSTNNVERPNDASSSMLSEGLYLDLTHEAESWANANEQLVQGSGSEMPIYTAARDGSPLVAFAAQYPQPGNRYFEQYRELHAANQYRHYRDLALWILLEAVLRHPADKWVREQVVWLAKSALSDTETMFHEALPLVLTALKKENKDAAIAALQASARRIESEDHSGRDILDDIWGYKRRFFGALAEAATGIPDAGAQSEQWLKQVMHTRGFAGFQYAARLALTESALICGEPGKTNRLLDMAEKSAQNINDAVFCLRSTARVQALKNNWWSGSVGNMAELVNLLAKEPGNVRFASQFQLGEQFSLRKDTYDKVSLPYLAYNAQSLVDVAELFRCSLSDLERLNPDFSPGMTVVHVPDTAFLSMIATRLSADLLANPAKLTFEQRLSLMLQLLPLVADDRSALDTILARILLLDPSRITGEQLAEISQLNDSI